MLTKPPAISWWESNSASLHQTQGGSVGAVRPLTIRVLMGRASGAHLPPGPGNFPRPELRLRRLLELRFGQHLLESAVLLLEILAAFGARSLKAAVLV
jgi:hypothetical protein